MGRDLLDITGHDSDDAGTAKDRNGDGTENGVGITLSVFATSSWTMGTSFMGALISD